MNAVSVNSLYICCFVWDFFFSSPFIIHYSDGIRVRHGHFVSVISIGKILKTWKMIIENTRYSQGIQPDSLALPEGHTDQLNLEKACWPFSFLFEMQSFTDSYPQVSFSWAGIIAYSFPTSMEAAYFKSHEVTCRFLVPWCGIEPLCTSQRKCRVLTTGPSENSLTSLWMHEINDFASTENGCVSIFGEVNEVATASELTVTEVGCEFDICFKICYNQKMLTGLVMLEGRNLTGF